MCSVTKTPQTVGTVLVIAYTNTNRRVVKVRVDYNVTYKTCRVFTAPCLFAFGTSACVIKPPAMVYVFLVLP